MPPRKRAVKPRDPKPEVTQEDNGPVRLVSPQGTTVVVSPEFAEKLVRSGYTRK